MSDNEIPSKVIFSRTILAWIKSLTDYGTMPNYDYWVQLMEATLWCPDQRTNTIGQTT